jgi:hypothetical protein
MVEALQTNEATDGCWEKIICLFRRKVRMKIEYFSVILKPKFIIIQNKASNQLQKYSNLWI